MEPRMNIPENIHPARPSGQQVLRGFASFVIAFALLFALARAMHGRASILSQELVGATVIAAAYLLSSRWIERQPPPELNLRGAAREFAAGLALGFGLFCCVMGVLFILGIYHPLSWGTCAGLGTGAVFAGCAAILEEILFRAYLFRVLSMAVGTWAAVLVTAAFFGAAHAANPGATVFSSVAIALEAGVLLAATYALTGRLWMPIAMHFGWNFAEGTVFGMSVSGGPAIPALSHGSLNGASILTGGAFGPEASVVAVLLCLGTGIFLLWRTVKLKRIQHPMWRH